MDTVAPARRNLAVDSYLAHGIPKDHRQWADSELDEWRASLEGAGRMTPAMDSQWRAMRAERERTGLEHAVVYRGTSLPDEVLAEAPLAWLAQRANCNCPQLPLLADRLHEEIEALRGESARGSVAAGKRLAAALKAAGPRCGVVQCYVAGAGMVGGLRLLVLGSQLQLDITSPEGPAAPVATGPACDAQWSRLRRIASLWRRIVRLSVAVSLKHAAPRGHARSVQSGLEWALPVAARAGEPKNALVARGDGISAMWMELLSGTDFACEQAQRYAAAGLVMRARVAAPFNPVLLDHGIDQALSTARRSHDLIGPLRPSTPSRDAVLSRVDDVAREMVRAYRAGVQVPLEEPADHYEIWRDRSIGPTLWIRVKSLPLALDVERSNRVVPAFRLRLMAGSLPLAADVPPPAPCRTQA